MTEPVFLLSLERSGSTLLQRLLATHSQIAALGETWLLVPHLYSTRSEGIYTEYGHIRSVRRLEDFCEHLPGGMGDFRTALRGFFAGLFEKAANGQRYFVDKAPLYSYVAPEICEVFPDAKVIFLWRNPLAIAASLVQSFGTPGKWNVYQRERDLRVGLERLTAAYSDNIERAYALRYEDLVREPEAELRRLLVYLDLPFENGMVGRLSSTRFASGDPLGTWMYEGVSKEPLEKWKHIMGSPLRKRWSANYLRSIGQRRLALIGYDLDELLSQLGSLSTRWDSVASDALRMTYGKLWTAAEVNVLRKQGERRWLLDELADRRKKRRARKMQVSSHADV